MSVYSDAEPVCGELGIWGLPMPMASYYGIEVWVPLPLLVSGLKVTQCEGEK